jgi:hypothetical protein
LGTGITAGNLTVNAVAVWNGGVYVAGNFTMAGSVAATNIARYDISAGTWSALASGIGNSSHPVSALCVYNNELYAGGNFTTSFNSPSNYIAKWTGSAWAALSGTGLSGGTTVSALTVFNNTLFIGGNFLQTPIGACHYVAMWNGAWSVPTNFINSRVFCFAIHNSELYLGGDVPSYIYKWVPLSSTWAAVANSFSSTGASILCMASYAGSLYASGNLITVGTSVNIAKLTGTTWSGVGTGFSPSISYALALTPLNGRLYAGGSFSDAGGTGAKYLASWNGTTWALGIAGNGLLGSVNAFDTLSTPKTIYAGGGFTSPYSCIMKSGSLIGIEEESLPDESVSIYPNPASDNIFISLKSELKNPRVEIYSVTGEKIYSDALTSRQKTINIQKYASGIYFVKITSGSDGADMKALTKKIVVE